MSITDSGMWEALSSFARKLGGSGDFIVKAKNDFNELMKQHDETIKTANLKCTPKELENSLSMQNFYPWRFEKRFFCLHMLFLSGFRHTALRELRFYLESSARCYYIDSKYGKKTHEDKVAILKEVRFIKFKNLLEHLPKEKQNELTEFYDELCNYVHLSEESQTDAPRDPSLNLALRYPYNEFDKEMLEKTFDYARYLLLETFGER